MDFYGYNDDDDAGEYHWTPNLSIPFDYYYDDDFRAQPYSSYGYSNSSEQIEQSSTSYYYYPTQIHQELISYSIHNSSEPQLMHYESGANSVETRHTISYSSTKLHDDTVFEEYDPTPYSGGYDVAQTYGKSLLPSSEICYPRSVLEPKVPNPNAFDYGSIPSPYLNNDQLKQPQNQSKDEQQSLSNVEEKCNKEDDDDVQQKPPQHDHEDIVVGNETITREHGYNDDYANQFQQIPYGSGLEAVDLCESLFGYWPCYCKHKQEQKRNNAEDKDYELWKSTADYLFGSHFGYEGGDGRYRNSAYSNQIYYYQQQIYE